MLERAKLAPMLTVISALIVSVSNAMVMVLQTAQTVELLNLRELTPVPARQIMVELTSIVNAKRVILTAVRVPLVG